MDDPKIRGKQHLKNKAKYKSYKSKSKGSTQITTTSPALTSNWDRFNDELSTNSDSSFKRAADYVVLAEAPISKGSHFQFKSNARSRFDVDNSTVNTNALFDVDLNLLGLSLASIPFIDRCSIPENYFTDTQLSDITKTAKESARLYQLSLQNHKLKISEELKDEEILPTRNKRTSVDETDFVTMANESLSPSDESLSLMLSNDLKDEYDLDYRDTFTKEGSNTISNDKPYTPIDKLNDLEVELDKIELMKSNTKNPHVKIMNSNEYNELLSPIQQGESSKSSCDVVDYCGGNSRDTAPASGDTLLETESLQQWLDDLLGD